MQELAQAAAVDTRALHSSFEFVASQILFIHGLEGCPHRSACCGIDKIFVPLLEHVK